MPDLDGDGMRDLRVEHASWGDPARREPWFVSARTAERSSKSGEVLMRLAVPEEARRSCFGRAILSLPDLDGDDVRDLAVAAPDDPFRSIVRAYSGKQGALLWESKRIEGEIGRVGASLASYSDVDADGVPEILVGSCDYPWHGANFREGSVRLLSGKCGRTLWCVREDEVPEMLCALYGPPFP